MPYLPEVFERAVEAHRSRVALVEESKQWTFAELLDDANRVAALLRDKVKGDTVGILLLNSQRYIATMLGVWKAGKTVVPLNYLLPPAELGFIIKDSGMSAIISSQFFAQALAAIKPLFGDKGVIVMADDPGFTEMSPDGPAAEYRDPALYLYTSGTTGRPKGVILTHDKDRKSTRLNSSHMSISYAVFCLKKKNKKETTTCKVKKNKIKRSKE